MQGKPLQQALQEFKDKASSGTQGAIKDELFSDWASQNLDRMREMYLTADSKKLTFSAPNSASAISMSAMAGAEGRGMDQQTADAIDSMMAGMQREIVRIGIINK